jgi:hypothetical protein
MSELTKTLPTSDYKDLSTIDTPKMHMFNKSATSAMYSPKASRDSNNETYKFMQSGLSVVGS